MTGPRGIRRDLPGTGAFETPGDSAMLALVEETTADTRGLTARIAWQHPCHHATVVSTGAEPPDIHRNTATVHISIGTAEFVEFRP